MTSSAVPSVQCRGCDGDCDACNQVMAERDAAIEMADKLAEKLAELQGIDIGEHTSGNCPWTNAFNGESAEAD